MLHDYITIRVPHRPRNLFLLSDNEAAQNKNHYTVWYLSWLVAIGLFDTIKLQFPVVGHTKNYCDSCFGLTKKALRGRDVCTVGDAKRIVREYAKCLEVVVASSVKFYDWEKFLEQFLQTESFGITQLHHLRFNQEHFGYVFVKESLHPPERSEKPVFLLKRDMTVDHLRNPEHHGVAWTQWA